MIIGDIKKIDLSVSSFERMITNGNLYIDKTRMIENFLNNASSVQLIARHRRLGKSLNMDMLRCFLTDKTDNRHLFKGLYIETSSAWEKVNSAPVFYFNFKGLNIKLYKSQIAKQIDKHLSTYLNPDDLSGYLKRCYDNLINDPDAVTDGLFILTELVYEITGKRSYILIDEYDKLLMDNYNTDHYDEIRSFETALLSSGLKDNQYLEKALLTGVMRISHESIMSGLNNLVTYDVFNDNIYMDDYGVTNDEAVDLSKLADFNLDEVKAWYNGVKINGHAIYNIYSLLSFINNGKFDCYWGKSGTLDIIVSLLNDERKLHLAKLLSGERVKVSIDDRISLKQLSSDTGDEEFYSLLVQAGYLSLDEKLPGNGLAMLTIPNKELLVVWKNFILKKLYAGATRIRTLFDNVGNLDIFSKDIEYFLCDRLSYYDLAVYSGENEDKVKERIYHIFLLGILSAYDDVRYRYPLSNRESGDGRYDVLVEKLGAHYIFEFKACSEKEDLDKNALEALKQIETKRYGADLDQAKPLIKVGIAFCGKQCRVKCS